MNVMIFVAKLRLYNLVKTYGFASTENTIKISTKTSMFSYIRMTRFVGQSISAHYSPLL